MLPWRMFVANVHETCNSFRTRSQLTCVPFDVSLESAKFNFVNILWDRSSFLYYYFGVVLFKWAITTDFLFEPVVASQIKPIYSFSLLRFLTDLWQKEEMGREGKGIRDKSIKLFLLIEKYVFGSRWFEFSGITIIFAPPRKTISCPRVTA